MPTALCGGFISFLITFFFFSKRDANYEQLRSASHWMEFCRKVPPVISSARSRLISLQMSHWTSIGLTCVLDQASNKGSYGSIIAYGHLTFELISCLWKQIALMQNVSLEINYGIEDLRFGIFVKVNSRVSLHGTIRSVDDLRG